MSIRPWSSFALLIPTVVAWSVMSPAARAGSGVSVSVNNDYTEVTLPTSPGDDIHLPIGASISIGREWSFYGFGFGQPTNGVDFLEAVGIFDLNPPGFPPRPPLPPQFYVVITSDTPVGLYRGTVTAEALSYGPGSPVRDTATASYQIYVRGPVPEPASALMLGLGVLGIAGLSVRRRA